MWFGNRLLRGGLGRIGGCHGRDRSNAGLVDVLKRRTKFVQVHHTMSHDFPLAGYLHRGELLRNLTACTTPFLHVSFA